MFYPGQDPSSPHRERRVSPLIKVFSAVVGLLTVRDMHGNGERTTGGQRPDERRSFGTGHYTASVFRPNVTCAVDNVWIKTR